MSEDTYPDFTRETKDRMKEFTERSLEEKREMASPVCRTERGLELGPETIGVRSEVREVKPCPVGDKVGVFHTHPPSSMSGRVSLSSSDVEYFVDNQENWVCVGGRDVTLSYPHREKKTNDVVRCFHAADRELKESRKKIDELWRDYAEGNIRGAEVHHKRKHLSPYKETETFQV